MAGSASVSKDPVLGDRSQACSCLRPCIPASIQASASGSQGHPGPGHSALIVCRSGVSACQGRIAAGQTAVRVGDRGDPGREKREHPKGTVGNPGGGGECSPRSPSGAEGGRAGLWGQLSGGRCGRRGRRRRQEAGVGGRGGGSHFKGSFLPIMLCGDVDKWIQDGVESNDR